MLDEETTRRILVAYHESVEGETPVPLMILHGLREEVTIRPHIELPSAYHMAHYLSDFVTENTVALTVCGRFYKQIGKRLFQGTILYHIDRIGSHLIRGIDSKTGHYNVLDDSPYWNKFPFDFDSGPIDPDLPIGFHPGPGPGGDEEEDEENEGDEEDESDDEDEEDEGNEDEGREEEGGAPEAEGAEAEGAEGEEGAGHRARRPRRGAVSDEE